MVAAGRRFGTLVILALGLSTLFFLASFRRSSESTVTKPLGASLPKIDTSLEQGHVIAPKLENATAKAELGRAAWKVLHTTFARFPEHPTQDEKDTLKTYIHLFQRLYPCGECAAHFGTLLEKFPPQVGSRNSAAGWGCFVHNEVNKRLKKPEFDCENIGDFYDCGCGDDDKDKKKAAAGGSEEGKDGEEKEKKDKSESERMEEKEKEK